MALRNRPANSVPNSSQTRDFARLPSRIRRSLISGATGQLSQPTTRSWIGLGYSIRKGAASSVFVHHTPMSPRSATDRTGDNNRGRGEENEIDVHYTATAVAIAREFVQRADSDIQMRISRCTYRQFREEAISRT